MFFLYLFLLLLSRIESFNDRLIDTIHKSDPNLLKKLLVTKECKNETDFKKAIECIFETECDASYCNSRGTCLIHRYQAAELPVAVCVCDPESYGISCDDVSFSCPDIQKCNNVTQCIRELGLWICLCPVGYNGNLCRIPLENWDGLIKTSIVKRETEQKNQTSRITQVIHNFLTVILLLLLVAVLVGAPIILYFYFWKPKNNIVEFFSRNDEETENLISQRK